MLGRGTEMAHDSHPHEGRKLAVVAPVRSVPDEYNPDTSRYWQRVSSASIVSVGEAGPICAVNPAAFSKLLNRVETHTSAEQLAPFESTISAVGQALFRQQPVIFVPSQTIQAMADIGYRPTVEPIAVGTSKQLS